MMDPLLRALFLRDPDACQVWAEWRAGLCIDELPYLSQLFLAALNPRVLEWLPDDPAEGIFRGIVRRAWTQNQLRLRKASRLLGVLEAAGIRPVAVAGPLAWSLSAAPAIRTIPYLTFLVPRHHASRAFEELVRLGGQPESPVPVRELMDWNDHVSFWHEDLWVKVYWRVFSVPQEEAAECESAVFSSLRPVRWNGATVLSTSPEVSLLQMLLESRERDPFPWEADLALMDPSSIGWSRVQHLALRFCPAALDRLEEVRRAGLWGVPDFHPPDATAISYRAAVAWRQYRSQCYWQKREPSRHDFARFLARRWKKRFLGPPLVGATRALRQFRGMLR